MRKSFWYTTLAFLGLSLCCGYILSLTESSEEEFGEREVKMIDYIPNPVVKTTIGQVQGINSKSRDGRDFFEFLKIPYAQPPIFDLRYEVPQPAIPWEGVLDASSYGDKCIQFDMLTDLIVGSEDCLYLNIFTPKLPPKRKFFSWSLKKRLLPVIVYVHGGHFMYGGSNEYRPEYFMDSDVVVITLNYRLNSFGFLNTGEGVSGNMGLKDQNMALKFIKKNVERFGGDPSRILLAGQSAGGASVHYHLLSPMSKGLFQKAVSFSGSALSPWAFTTNPKEQAERFAKSLDCPINRTAEMLKCLKSIDAHKIVNTHTEIHDILNDRLSFFSPTLESPSSANAESQFIIDTPENLIRNGNIANKVPWMTGVTSEEGLIFLMGLFFDKDGAKRLNSDWNLYAPRLFGYEDLPISDRSRISQKIRVHYLHNKDIAEHLSVQNAEQLFTDANFNYGFRQGALEHSKHQQVFLYYYSHKGVFGFYQAFQAMSRAVPKVVDWAWSLGYRWFHYELAGKDEIHYGTSHGDDSPLLWKIPLLSHIKTDSEDYYVSKAFVRAIVDFASGSEPLKYDGVKWDSMESTGDADKPLKLMRIASNSEIVQEPFYKSLAFWRKEIINDIKTTRNYNSFKSA